METKSQPRVISVLITISIILYVLGILGFTLFIFAAGSILASPYFDNDELYRVILLGVTVWIVTITLIISLINLHRKKKYFRYFTILLAVGVSWNLYFLIQTNAVWSFLGAYAALLWIPQIIVFLYYLTTFRETYPDDNSDSKPKRKPIVYTQ